MKGGRHDWLDALAYRSPRRVIASTPPRTDGVDDRYSRTRALKLALVGATSVAIGLRAAPARAQTRGECFTQCFEKYDTELVRRLNSCEHVFAQPGVSRSWAAFGNSLVRPFAVARLALLGICYAQAASEVSGAKHQCNARCEQTCFSRRAQTVSSFSDALEPTCEVTPPHKAPPPEIPTPPNPDNDVCSICAGQGNVCCPGGSVEAGGLCACAPPETPCETYAGSCA